MPSLADQLADAFVGHRLDLLRFEAHEAAQILKLFTNLEAELTATLAKLDPTGVAGPTWRQKRLQALLASTKKIISGAYRTAEKTVNADLTELAQVEATAAAETVNTLVHVPLLTVGINADTARALVHDLTIEGAPAHAWWSRQDATLRNKFADQMRLGVAQGETLERLIRRVRGTQAAGFADGIMQVTRRDAESLVRTSVQSVANAAQHAAYHANADLLKGLQWLATFDGRVCAVCVALSGKAWDLDGDPIDHDQRDPGPPPIHFRCRCVRIPLLRSWASMVKDPVKRKRVEAALAKVPPGVRSSMDGAVAADLSFDDWLKSKPIPFQRDVLGPGKWALWKDGKITLADLIDQSHRPLSLAQLEDLVNTP